MPLYVFYVCMYFNLSISLYYLLLTLHFCSADNTKSLPDGWVQAFWYIFWSIQLLHGLKHLDKRIGSQRTTETLLFEWVVVVVSLSPHLLNPEA